MKRIVPRAIAPQRDEPSDQNRSGRCGHYFVCKGPDEFWVSRQLGDKDFTLVSEGGGGIAVHADIKRLQASS